MNFCEFIVAALQRMGYRSVRLGRPLGVLPDLETKQEEKNTRCH